MIEAIRRRLSLLWLALTIKPIRGGAEDGDGDGEGDGSGDGSDDTSTGDAGKTGGDADDAAAGGDGDDDSGDGEDKGGEKSADDYRRELRNYERTAKRASAKDKKEIEKLQKQLKEREDADKTEQEKAIEAARNEGADKARLEALKDRRQDRLEAASVRLASKGIKIKDGDEEVTVKFADPEDALVHLERAITRGEVDSDAVFDENNQVKSAELTELLAELLEKKPHLREADSGKDRQQPAGDADAGKGRGEDEGGKKLEEMSVEDHFNRIKRHKD